MSIEERLRRGMEQAAGKSSGNNEAAHRTIQERLHGQPRDRLNRLATIVFALAVSAIAVTFAITALTPPAMSGRGRTTASGEGGTITPLGKVGDGGRALVASAGAVWAGTNGAIVRVDPSSDQTTAVTTDGPSVLATTSDYLWASGIGSGGSGTVIQLDESGQQIGSFDFGGTVQGLAGTPGSDLWVLTADGTGAGLAASRVNPTDGSVIGRTELDNVQPALPSGAYRVVTSAAMGGDTLWILAMDLKTDESHGSIQVLTTQLISIGPDMTATREATVPGASAIAYNDGAIWISRGTSQPLRFDISTENVSTLDIPSAPLVFRGPDQNVYFVVQSTDETWQLVSLDPGAGLRLIADLPSSFVNGGSLIGGVWDGLTSSAWLLNESGELLRIDV